MNERKMEKERDRCIKTITELVQNVLDEDNKDDYFYVGYASVPAHLSGGRKDWGHIVVLADQMYCDDAIRLEADIQNAISDNPALLRKYHPEKISKKAGRITIRRNSGGRKPRTARCSVYMLWG